MATAPQRNVNPPRADDPIVNPGAGYRSDDYTTDPVNRRPDRRDGSNMSILGWIAGALVALLILYYLLAGSSMTPTGTSTTQPNATGNQTQTAPAPTPAPAPAPDNVPATGNAAPAPDAVPTTPPAAPAQPGGTTTTPQ